MTILQWKDRVPQGENIAYGGGGPINFAHICLIGVRVSRPASVPQIHRRNHSLPNVRNVTQRW